MLVLCAGIGMSYAIAQAGILLGLLIIILLAMITDYSLIMLIKAGQLSGTSSYQGVMTAAFGTPGFVLLSMVQFIYPFIGKSQLMTIDQREKDPHLLFH